MENDKVNTIAPAIAAALLKAPHAAEGGSILKEAAKELDPGVHYVAGVVEFAGHVTRQPDYRQARSTIDRKAMVRVMHWAFQRMSQKQFDALARQLDQIADGTEEVRNLAHDDRVKLVMERITRHKVVQCSGKVEWTGTLSIDDLNAFDADESDVSGHGLTLVGGAK